MWQTILNNFPSIIAVLGVLATAIINYQAQKNKNSIENKTASSSAEQQLRDDLIEIAKERDLKIITLEEKQDKQQDRIDKLQEENRELRYKNSTLEYNNTRLQKQVDELREELAKFERKVYYNPSQS